MIGVKFNVLKNMFFDRPAVLRAMDKTTRSTLGRFGAFVRKVARWSIKKRRGTSKPGQPPYSHTGLLRRFIFFAYEPASRSVVIGPAKLNRSGQAPSILEYGGVTEIPKWFRERAERQILKKGRRIRVSRTARIAPRPYMAPAFAKGQAKLDSFWRESIRR